MVGLIALRWLVLACLLPGLLFVGCSKNSVSDDEVVDDGIGPANVTDLTIAAFTDSSVTLAWTATGDDDTLGTAARYDLRCARSLIHYANFDSAVAVTGLPHPQAAGTAEQFEVRGLMADSSYHFALRVYDEEDNYNGISNCVSATCFNDFSISIPDPGLLSAIRQEIGKPSGAIMKSDLLPMVNLFAENFGITSLAGLEYCEQLRYLNINDNAISDLSPLSGLIDLNQLLAGNNSISNLSPLVGQTNLERLSLPYNDIVSIAPISTLTALESLDLQRNEVTDVTVIAGLTELQWLGLSYNHIRDITPLVQNAGLGSGDDILLSYNPLTHESIMSHIPALRSRGATVLWATNVFPPNGIADLAVNTVTGNTVTLSWTATGEDYNEGIAYRYQIRYSTIRSDIENWTGSDTVPNLPVPDTVGTHQAVTVTGLQEDSVYYFGIRTQDNSENWSPISNIVSAQPYTDIVITLTDAALESAVRNALQKPTGDILRSDLAGLDSLVANNLGISSLAGLEYCVNMRYLNISQNSLTDINELAGMLRLYALNISDNSVSDITPLEDMTGLMVLQLDSNPISDLAALSDLLQLRVLTMSFIATGDIQPLENLSSLQYLFAAGDGIADISPLSGLGQLQNVYLDYNSIVSLTPLRWLGNLSVLSLRDNDIADLTPLVDNMGIATGDQVALENNPLSADATTVQIPALQARGVTVTY